MIRFEAVTKRYDDGTVAVDALDLEAPTGKITTLVGPSGCGKTTSLRMVNRMIVPTAGRIMLDDRDTASVPAAQLRRGIGYVIQNAGLFPHRTIAENIATVPNLLGWSKVKSKARAMELLERVGLPATMAGRYPTQLSGGQQQRVGVARALAADPPVMLMDEPFSAVDPVVRLQLQDEFKRLQSELGKTILFVTHDIDEAIKLGDTVVVLRVGGKLAQVGPPHEVLTNPTDDFVADFVGRDRGYRALGFALPATKLVTEPEPTIAIGATIASASPRADGWQLVVDAGGAPAGWLDITAEDPAGVVDQARLRRSGTVAATTDSLRALLDAALSSPSGRGVVVDEDRRVVGTVTGEVVLEAINASRQPAAAVAADRGSR